MPTHDVIDLTPLTWRIRHDPEGLGLREGWAEGEWETSREIDLPCSWHKVLGTGAIGVAWYRAGVDVPREWLADASSVLRLRFGSVATHARAWVNGIEVGSHVGDSIPFEFRVPNHALAKRTPAVLVVRVDQMHAPRPAPGTLTENGHLTKGFHDVLSLQHAGIWQPVSLRRTGRLVAIPNGLVAYGDPDTGRVEVRVEVEPGHVGGRARFEVAGSDGKVVGSVEAVIRVGEDSARGEVVVASAQAWSPEDPVLYSCRVTLLEGEHISEVERVRFGFRRLSIGGTDHRRLLLNGRPLLVRGVLHWGHEPEFIAPAPTPEQVRAEFRRLREMGFNCVCLCMVYMDEAYYEIADEEGMLLWQEHPVWKSAMGAEHLPEYRRVLAACFRRDRRHASVVIVSGSCEHESIHPDLASWWWARAKRELPDRVAQVQTAFIAWTNPDQTDLHDEHVYDNSGRWVRFVEDVRATLEELPPRPFVMGETIIGTSWVDTRAFKDRTEWWIPRGVGACAALEARIAERFGAGTLDRFRRQAEHANLGMRKFQSEALRFDPGNAGWVMNQIRDVPLGRMGFMDDLGRWRFGPDQTRAWLSDAALLLRTRDERRGFFGGATIEAKIGISNFSRARAQGEVRIEGVPGGGAALPIVCEPGEAAFVPFPLVLPEVERVSRVRLSASMQGLEPNAWDLWVFPRAGEIPPGVSRLDGLPIDARDSEPEFEERAYSSGWGMACRTWTPIVQHPTQVLFRCPLFRFDGPMPAGTRVVAAHRLTPGLVEWMRGGGRVLLLAGRTRPALSTRFVCFWGQCPLVPEAGVLGAGESEWVVDLLHNDLSRRTCRAIPTEELGLAEEVEPIVRLVFTHDQGRPKVMDSVLATRVGRGVLLASALDHTEDAGQYLLHRLLRFLLGEAAEIKRETDPARLEGWARLER